MATFDIRRQYPSTRLHRQMAVFAAGLLSLVIAPPATLAQFPGGGGGGGDTIGGGATSGVAV